MISNLLGFGGKVKVKNRAMTASALSNAGSGRKINNAIYYIQSLYPHFYDDVDIET
jgi:hypothetical protein